MSQKKDIIQILLTSNRHVRGIAKILGTNQTTIARRMQELYKENVVDFRQEGKNKVFFIKKSLEAKQNAYLVEIQKVIELIQRYPFLRRTIELIKIKKKIPLAILFGSYAKGSANKESDIDIYIDTLDKMIKEEVELINSKINVKIGRYNQNSLLLKEIEKNHIILKGVELYYEKNGFFG